MNNNLDKTFIETTINNYKLNRRIDDNMLLLMYHYYNDVNKKENLNIYSFDNFKELFYLWVTIPLSINGNITKQTFNKGIINTINYFKTKTNG